VVTPRCTGAPSRAEFLPKLRIEIVADDADVDKIVAAIVENARTNSTGDGKYWVIPVETVGRM
jgi:nitrogen regulatory protein P-II 1